MNRRPRRPRTTNSRRRRPASSRVSIGQAAYPTRATRQYAAAYSRSTDINVVSPHWPNRPAGFIRVKRFSSSDLSFTSSTSASTGTGYYVTLDGVAGYSDFTSLFDQYRIVSFIVEGVSATDTANGVSFIIAPDYDDASNSTYDNLLQYSSAVRIPWGKNFSVAVPRPAIDGAVFATGSATRTGLNLRAPWIDCGAADVQHFGFKVASPATPAGARTLTLQISAIIEFRGTR